MKLTYSGGCHCGAVRYQVEADLSQGTVRCNCSICSKARSWLAAVGVADFKLVQGEENLGTYQFGAHKIRHLFCKTCGVKSFGHGGQFIAVMVNCLDGISDAELAELPVVYVDGRNDDFKSPPAETRYL